MPGIPISYEARKRGTNTPGRGWGYMDYDGTGQWQSLTDAQVQQFLSNEDSGMHLATTGDNGEIDDATSRAWQNIQSGKPSATGFEIKYTPSGIPIDEGFGVGNAMSVRDAIDIRNLKTDDPTGHQEGQYWVFGSNGPNGNGFPTYSRGEGRYASTDGGFFGQALDFAKGAAPIAALAFGMPDISGLLGGTAAAVGSAPSIFSQIANSLGIDPSTVQTAFNVGKGALTNPSDPLTGAVTGGISGALPGALSDLGITGLPAKIAGGAINAGIRGGDITQGALSGATGGLTSLAKGSLGALSGLLSPEQIGAGGKPFIDNPDGSFSTERSITVTEPSINGGMPTNIPTIVGGRQLSDEDAIMAASQSGINYPSFASIPAAVSAAQARSDAIGRAAGVSSGTDPLTMGTGSPDFTTNPSLADLGGDATGAAYNGAGGTDMSWLSDLFGGDQLGLDAFVNQTGLYGGGQANETDNSGLFDYGGGSGIDMTGFGQQQDMNAPGVGVQYGADGQPLTTGQLTSGSSGLGGIGVQYDPSTGLPLSNGQIAGGASGAAPFNLSSLFSGLNSSLGGLGSQIGTGLQNFTQASSDQNKSLLNSIQSLLGGQQNASMLGALGGGLFNYLGQKSVADANTANAQAQRELGAPYRANALAAMQPGFDPNSIGGYSGAVDSASKGILARLSATGGNPFGNPGGLIEANKQIIGGTAMPAIQNYINSNLSAGFGPSYAASQAPQTAADKLAGAGFDAGGGALANVLSPATDLDTLLAGLKKYGLSASTGPQFKLGVT